MLEVRSVATANESCTRLYCTPHGWETKPAEPGGFVSGTGARADSRSEPTARRVGSGLLPPRVRRELALMGVPKSIHLIDGGRP